MNSRIIKSLKRSWQRNYKNQITTYTVLVLTFSVLLSFWSVFGNIKLALFGWGDQIKLDVYLDEGVNKNNSKDIYAELKNSKFYEKINYIPKEQAIKDYQTKLKTLEMDLMGENGVGNPLPNAYELILTQNATVAERFSEVKRIAEKLLNINGVDEASYGQSWIENYKMLIKGFSSTSIGIMIILFIGSLMIIGNAINSSISQRNQEIEIFELIGATKWTIQVPFIIEGAFLGFISMITALFVGKFISSWQSGILNTDLGFLGIQWSYLSFFECSFMVFMGVVTGMLGSYFCVKNINSGWSAAEKKV